MLDDEGQLLPHDQEIQAIVDYVCHYKPTSEEAYHTAYWCLLDSLGCGLLALKYPACNRLLGPIVEDTVVPYGVRVPGTHYRLDPVQAAFNIGAMIRWLDFNDTWLAAEWGHPSDNLGALLAVMDYLDQRRGSASPLLVHDLLTAMIKAYEIQGVLALENSFNRVGLDHVLLVKVASTAIATQLLGGTTQQICDAVSQAWLDGHSLRTYRHAPNTGSRKSWAAGDATSRAVRLALLTLKGEMGYPTALSTKTWGFSDVLFHGKPLVRERDYASYVMENILFKISYPAEFHAQTAVECALQLHVQVKNRLDEIERVEISTQESAKRIIDKTGPLNNPADRDHCLQYMVAIGLIFGELTADHYQDDTAQDPRIDALRDKMNVTEDPQYSRDYLDPNKRSIPNAIQVYFSDGSSTNKVVVEYPVGHRQRRKEGIPLLKEKFHNNVYSHFEGVKADKAYHVCLQEESLIKRPIRDFMAIFAS